MTDTPRTTAPATEGDALTAEQIAHLREVANGLAFIDDSNLIAADLTALLTSHAVLRDRLARAEERERELTDALENAHSTLYTLSHICNDYRYMGGLEDHRALIRAYATGAQATRMRIHAALLATSTDGAARPRRSADGDATGGESE
jgi:hypothetical protein